MRRLFSFLLIWICCTLSGKEETVRIVSLSPALTETVCMLGGERFLVGRSAYCNYPESVKKLPVAGGFGVPETERILKLKPTHIISNDLINPSAAKRFESFGIKVMIRQSSSPEDYRFWVRNIGMLTGLRKAAAKEDARGVSELADIRKRAEKIPAGRRKKAVWLVWDAPLMIAGHGSLPDTVMSLAGCRNIASGVKNDYFKASPEWIEREDPDVIIWPGLKPSKRAELVRRAPWKNLSAVKNGCFITDIDEDLVLRPGPRLFTGIRLLQKMLYPSVCQTHPKGI